MKTHVINPPVAASLGLRPVADEAVGPDPLHVLHRAARLLEHDVAQAGIVRGSGAIGDGEVAARVVAVEEEGDAVDKAGTVLGIRRQGEAAVCRDVQGDLDEF